MSLIQRLVEDRSYRAVAVGVLLVSLVGCDQATKHYAQEHLKPRRFEQPYSYLGDTVRIHYAENEGAFLGLGGSLPDHVRFWLLTVLNGVVLAAVAAFLLGSRDVDGVWLIALALILAGGVGNLIDRVMLNGLVVDFLNLGIGSLIRTGIFNVADIAITAGFFLLLPVLFLPQKPPPATVNEAGTADNSISAEA